MKVTGEALRRIVAQMVREEIQRVLPGMVAERVSELYMRRVVSEIVGRGPEAPAAPPRQEARPSTRQAMSQLVERQQSQQREARNALLSPENPLAELFEGVSPLDEREAQADEGIPLENLGIDMGLLGAVNRQMNGGG